MAKSTISYNCSIFAGGKLTTKYTNFVWKELVESLLRSEGVRHFEQDGGILTCKIERVEITVFDPATAQF